MWDEAMVSCFNIEQAKLFIELSEGKVKLACLYNDYEGELLPPPEEYTSIGQMVGVDVEHITPEVVQNIHEAGQKVLIYYTYTEEDPQHLAYLVSLGVDRFCTSRPVQMKKIIDKWISQ